MAQSNESEDRSGTTRRNFLKVSAVITSGKVAGTLGLGSSDVARGSDILRVGVNVSGRRSAGMAEVRGKSGSLQAVEIVHPWPRTHSMTYSLPFK
jgi:hypothetical protein